MPDASSKELFGRWLAVAVAVALVAFGGLTLATVQLARVAQFWVSHTQTVIAESKSLLASMVDAETGGRGYIITGDENFLQLYREALTNAPLHIGRLRELTSDNPVQQKQLDQIEPLVNAKLEILAKSTDARRQGQAPGPVDKAIMNRFRAAEQAVEAEENRLLNTRTATLNSHYNLIAGVCALFVLLTALATIFGFRKYAQIRARALTAAAVDHLAAIVASSTDAIISKSLDGKIISWNSGATRLFGHVAEDMVGQPITRIIPPELIEDEKQILSRLQLGERINEYETQRLAKDGRLIDVSLTISPIKDAAGRIIGASKIARDISERKKAEEALGNSEQRLRRVYDSGLMGFVTWKMNGEIVDANDKFLAMVGYDRADLAAGRINWKQMTPPEFKSLGSFVELKATAANSVPFEKEYFRKDGSRVPVLAARALFDEERGDGVAMIIDITERKLAEKALVLAKLEAERANFAKSKFLAAASHDLRQPVQSLTLLLSAIERHVKDKPKAANMVSMANASMASLNGMLTGILDISRLDAGVITTDIASVDLGELIDRLAREYAPRAAANGLVLRHVPRVAPARTDVALLERILRNLLENALRYTSKGGVLIGVRQRGERVRIDVIDTGIGIAAEHQTEIFEEFWQLDNPARDSSQGLGLGLAIVSRLARLIGCEIQVASKLDHGTRFSLLLPLEKLAPPAARAAPVVEDAGGRILIIEDNAGIRQAYEIMLADWGYETLSAASGEEALDLAARAQWEFDAIVADHRLGSGLTGNAAANEIARRAGHSFPTMLVTGDTGEDRLTEVCSSGFALLHKPVAADDLRRTLASVLRGSDRPAADGR